MSENVRAITELDVRDWAKVEPMTFTAQIVEDV